MERLAAKLKELETQQLELEALLFEAAKKGERQGDFYRLTEELMGIGGQSLRDLESSKDELGERKAYYDKKEAAHEAQKPIDREEIFAGETKRIEGRRARIVELRGEIQELMDRLDNFEPTRELRNFDPDKSDDPLAWAMMP